MIWRLFVDAAAHTANASRYDADGLRQRIAAIKGDKYVVCLAVHLAKPQLSWTGLAYVAGDSFFLKFPGTYACTVGIG